MTRSETVEAMEYHRREAESALARAEGYGPPIAGTILAIANAHAALAIFYQGELKGDQSDSEPSDKYKKALEKILEVRSRRLASSPHPIESGPENWEVRTMRDIAQKALGR